MLGQRSIGLLVVNKQLYDELIIHLCQLFTLSLYIDPTAPDTEFQILNSKGESWGPTRSLKSHHLDHQLFKGMKVDRFKEIKISVGPTNPAYPGQLVRAWLQVTRLVNALSAVWKNPHRIPASFLDIRLPIRSTVGGISAFQQYLSDLQKCTTGNGVTRTLPTTRAFRVGRHGVASDIGILLIPFLRIRTQRLHIDLPTHRAAARCAVDDQIEDLQADTTSTVPFGLNSGWPVNYHDSLIMRQEGAMSLWLDDLLDNMKGATARYLQPDRFETWCDVYKRNLGQCLFGYKSGTRTVGGAASV
ncbi:uncharacterized protein A1O9_09945, partial [Exophiala aquamarina CBS 119918]